jgi:hypothetical protein
MSELGARDARERFAIDQIVDLYEHIYKTTMAMIRSSL